MPFTHVAMYMARVITDNITGNKRTARYDGIPRVVFTDPEVAAVGLTSEQAQQQGISTTSAEVDLAKAIARPWTYENNPRGHLGVLADVHRRTLIGAWAVGPQASEWIHTAALAVREQIPIERLLDQVAQFPTYNEGWLKAIERAQGVRTASRTRETPARNAAVPVAVTAPVPAPAHARVAPPRLSSPSAARRPMRPMLHVGRRRCSCAGVGSGQTTRGESDVGER
jgi:hypothetical protein